MVYDDPLSQWCIAKDPKWPPKSFLKQEQFELDAINSQLREYDFDIKEWKEYKLNITIDGLERKYHHPKVEYPLTKEEYQALKDSLEHPMDIAVVYDPDSFCNPILCPKAWGEDAKQYGPFYQRFWWILWQENWLVYGYPQLPRVIWDKNNFILDIFEDLIYKPFMRYWSTIPDKFWIILSNALEGENHHRLLKGFVLYFHSIGRIFPSPAFYTFSDDSDPDLIFHQV